MKFEKALNLMQHGQPVKRPGWGGYWEWDDAKETIIMHCRKPDSDTGRDVMDLRETVRMDYTLRNICADDWEEATEENCEVLGGTNRFGFDQAIRYLKDGKKVKRAGWNGKGMFLCLADFIEFHTPADLSCVEDLTGNLTLPTIVMKTADDRFCVGWLASQADMLAEDWTFA